MRVPTVKRGQRLTARLWNSMAATVNDALAAPRDLDAGLSGDEIPPLTERELRRTTVTERVTSPDDEDVYVDVAHVTSITTRDASTGQIKTTYFADQT